MSNSEKPQLNAPAFGPILPAALQEPGSQPIAAPDAIAAGAKLRARLALTGRCGMAITSDLTAAATRPETRH